MPKSDPVPPAHSFKDVLKEELEQVSTSRIHREVPLDIPRGEDPYDRALDSGLIGLAFSGGGIRSATFNLGLLQGIARYKMLHAIDYLSTVSGGGYIGSWFHAWVSRSPGGLAQVEDELSARPTQESRGGPAPVHFLRRYANYLTPKTGLLSSDTWTMISIWLRNTLLNQIVLFLFLTALLLAPRCLKEIVDVTRGAPIAILIALPLMFLAVFVIGLNLTTFERSPTVFSRFLSVFWRETLWRGEFWFHRPAYIQLLVVVPMLLVAFLTSSWFAHYLIQPDERSLIQACAFIASGFFGFLTLISFVGGLDRGFSGDTETVSWKSFVVVPLINAVAAGLGGVVLYLCCQVVRHFMTQPPYSLTVLAWGLPSFLMIVTFVVVLQIGLLGRNFPDERREWWSRLGAAIIMHMIAWVAVCSIAIYGPQFLLWVHSKLDTAWSSGALAGWASTVAAGLWASTKPQSKEEEKVQRPVLNFFARLAPPVFIVGIFLFLSMLIHLASLYDCRDCFVNFSSSELSANHLVLMSTFPGWQAFLSMLSLLTAAWLLASRVDINEFSLHQFYRNRLVRCYLGASRSDARRPNLFTGFDPDDDLTISSLRPKENGYNGPYPIINTALNLVHGENLAWQERKAESFIFTPSWCGFDVENNRSTHHGKRGDDCLSEYGYRPTKEYSREGGPKIGQALAISGAAASPNSGYHSAPATGFLMTVFDVRLGWWIGNPRHCEYWKAASPTSGLLYLLNELMGRTNDRQPFVYLSDGGHFENLGVYELVRRRCRFIIASDAEQDECYRFEGLGNAIRKCRTDLGVEIEIEMDRLQPNAETGFSGAHCVVGTIRYPERDRNGQNIMGTLLYIKATMTGDEPGDVMEHKRKDRLFPHTPTSDQWFDESQFESYRRLGVHVANSVFGNVAEDVSLVSDREKFFRMISQQWYPPSRAVQNKFTEHARACSNLMERLRKDADLRFMAAQISPEWPTLMKESIDPARTQMWLPHKESELRAGFQLCNSMIQLMETVYIDLNLEEEWSHPDNRGWMNLFNHWVWSSMFRVTWAASVSCYGARFQNFCQKRLELPMGEVRVKRGQFSDLNFYEKLRFEQYGDPTDAIWNLELEVKNPWGKDQSIAYRFGFAVVDSECILRFYRVQNHLRRMGLWTAVEPVLRDASKIKGFVARKKE